MLIKENTNIERTSEVSDAQIKVGISVSILKDLERKWRYLTSQDAFLDRPLITPARLIEWWLRSLLHWSATIKLHKWDMQMFLPADWRGIAKLLFAFRERYEPELCQLERFLSPGKVFVDVGACYGIYTLAASRIVGEQGRVIAFEPALRAFRVLQRNIVLNRVTNTLAYPLALADKQGKAQLYHHPNVGCDSLGRDHSFTRITEEVETEPLDSVLRENSIDHVDLIKMDVQGAEELVLRGARKILDSSRPIVIFEFEVYPPCTIPLGLAPYGAWAFLENLGYEFFIVHQSGALQRQRSLPTDRNVVAIPRQGSTNSERTLLTPDEMDGLKD
jgi:FkbM family methyltransferase